MVCEGNRSNSAQATSGAPRGTVLGLLLFLLYVNDLPNNLKSSIRLFSDDALLYGIVSNDVDGDQLQKDLKKLDVGKASGRCHLILLSARPSISLLRKSPHRESMSFVESSWSKLSLFLI